MNEKRLLNCIGDIDPAYVINAENKVSSRIIPMRTCKRYIIPAAAIIALMLTGTVFASYLGGWLNDFTKWWVADGTTYVEQTKSEVVMRHNQIPGTFDTAFEFTGADSAIYAVDADNDNIIIYAQRGAADSMFTMVIPEYDMHGFYVRERLMQTEPGNIIRSRTFDLIVVDDLSGIK